MNFGRSFQFVFEDSDWLKKIGLMALVSLIPVVGQFVVMGWALEILRGVVRGADTPLPELDFGEQLGDGFKAAVVGVVYMLPAIVLIIIMAAINGISMAALDSDTAGIVSMISSICFGGLTFIYYILIALILPAAVGNYAMKGSISDGLRIGEVFGLFKKNVGGYLLVLVGILVAGIVGGIGVIACIIGVLVTAIYANAMVMHLTGQAYKKSIEG